MTAADVDSLRELVRQALQRHGANAVAKAVGQKAETLCAFAVAARREHPGTRSRIEACRSDLEELVRGR